MDDNYGLGTNYLYVKLTTFTNMIHVRQDLFLPPPDTTTPDLLVT
jgi:hypothetical protein